MAYDDAARRIVTAWKERGVRDLACLAADVVVAGIQAPAADCVTFVPPDDERQLRRGVHPAESLARELAARWHLPLASLLQRTRDSTRQRALSELARRRNLAGVFAATDGITARLLLIDDIYTTGATANAAASALRRAGARHVDVVTFARTLKRS